MNELNGKFFNHIHCIYIYILNTEALVSEEIKSRVSGVKKFQSWLRVKIFHIIFEVNIFFEILPSFFFAFFL